VGCRRPDRIRTAITISALVISFSGFDGAVAVEGASQGVTAEVIPTHTVFDIVFHVVGEDEAASWRHIARKVARANELFRTAGIQFAFSRRESGLPAEFRVLETIRERHRLKRFIRPNEINVFVVDRILDPNPSEATRKAARWQGRTPSGRLAGAHIPHHKGVPDTYIINTATSDLTTLAHELGHLFRLSHHRDPANVMSYGRERVAFTPKQLKTIRRTAKKLKKGRGRT
jgi:hypothetical protein